MKTSPVPCTLMSVVRNPDESVTIYPDAPIFGVAPGQAAFFYDGTRVLGGGWIQPPQ
jgi:tRNA U34 2-thiouridine synthase MnmA/TrmU